MGDSRRRWSPEFKRDAVALVRSSGRPIAPHRPRARLRRVVAGLLADEGPPVAGGGGP